MVLRLAPWRIAFALTVAFVLLSPGRLLNVDAFQRLVVAKALWHTGAPFLNSQPSLLHVPGKGDTSYFGMGQSIAFIPFDWLGSHLRHWAPSPALSRHVRLLPVLFLYAPLVAVCWWWASALLLNECGLSRQRAYPFSALILLTTIALPYATQSLQEEAPVGALVTAAFAFALKWRRSRLKSAAFWTGVFAGAALNFRLMSFFALLPAAVVLASTVVASAGKDRRGWLPLALGLFPLLAVLFYFNAVRFGNPFSSGYAVYLRQVGGAPLFRAPQPEIFLGVLFGLGKGFLWLSPPLWLAFLGWKHLETSLKTAFLAVPVALLACAFLCSIKTVDPDGSECWGARYLVHLILLFAYPIYLGAKRSPRLALVCLSLGVLIQVAASLAPEGLEYGQADTAGVSRDWLIYGIESGQLARRFHNIGAWFSGVEVTKYIPNWWGLTFSRHCESDGCRQALPAVWYGGWLFLLLLFVQVPAVGRVKKKVAP